MVAQHQLQFAFGHNKWNVAGNTRTSRYSQFVLDNGPDSNILGFSSLAPIIVQISKFISA